MYEIANFMLVSNTGTKELEPFNSLFRCTPPCLSYNHYWLKEVELNGEYLATRLVDTLFAECSVLGISVVLLDGWRAC